MPRLHRLPPDLLCRIVSFLNERCDLLSATITCRCLHDAASATLYEKIALDEARPFDHILAMLSPDNIGLKYIRHIRLCLNSEINHCCDSSQRPGFKMIHAFANLLARDSLLSFVVEGSATLPSDLMRVLYRRQKMLRNIRIDDGTGPRHLFYPKNGPPVTIDDGFDWILECIDPRMISTLHLCLRKMSSISASRKILAMCRNIDRLQIDFAGYLAYGVDLESALRSGRMAHMADDVLQYVFGCAACSPQWGCLDSAAVQDGSEWRLPLRLKQLHLKNIHLEIVARTLAQSIDLTVLEELECYSCISVDTLISLRGDHNTYLLTGLKQLSILAPPGALYATQVDALNAYLDSFAGLESLITTNTVRGDSMALPMMNAIVRHYQSLRSLYVDCYNENGGGTYVWDFESLYRLSVACAKLEELALALPGLQYPQSHGSEACAWPGSGFNQSMASSFYIDSSHLRVD